MFVFAMRGERGLGWEDISGGEGEEDYDEDDEDNEYSDDD